MYYNPQTERTTSTLALVYSAAAVWVKIEDMDYADYNTNDE